MFVFSALITLARLKYNERGWGILMTVTITTPPSHPWNCEQLSYSTQRRHSALKISHEEAACHLISGQFSSTEWTLVFQQLKLTSLFHLNAIVCGPEHEKPLEGCWLCDSNFLISFDIIWLQPGHLCQQLDFHEYSKWWCCRFLYQGFVVCLLGASPYL